MPEVHWSRSPEFREYAEHALSEMLPKLRESEFSISIAPRADTTGDVKYWIELGASIMLDKPILLLVEPGQGIPDKLRLVADLIVECDMGDEASKQRAMEKIAVFAESHRG